MPDVAAPQPTSANRDVPRLLEHDHDLNGEDAEAADKERRGDDQVDHGVVLAEHGDEARVRLLPALRVVMKERLDVGGHALRFIGSVSRASMRPMASGRQCLHVAEQGIAAVAIGRDPDS